MLDRLTASLRHFGEPILIEAEEAQAFVRVVSPAEARLFLEDAAVTGAGRPIRSFFVMPETIVGVGDALTWLGDAYQVTFIRRYRVGGEDLGLGLIALRP